MTTPIPERPAYLSVVAAEALAAPPPKPRFRRVRKDIDYAALEVEFRSTKSTTRALGKRFGISHTRVQQLARELGWTRDIAVTARVQAEAMLTLPVADNIRSNPALKKVLETTALVMAGVKQEHRDRIAFYRDLADSMARELRRLTDRPDVLEVIGELCFKPDEHGRDPIADTYAKVISLPGRVSGMKDLAGVLKILIALEREAFDLDVRAPEEAPPLPVDKSMDPREAYAWFAAQTPDVAEPPFVLRPVKLRAV